VIGVGRLMNIKLERTWKQTVVDNGSTLPAFSWWD
jgi:hypothetical protein